ncbi:hypothetical protein HXX02_10630 [Microbulbifer elongatus]|uniref:Uncharacterized protein n=1 Tax=Microbulbifer elongatus TaxID=86173 RepID=A0ABT1P1B4_9GAMM|nr:hypothetical protein [Microbulbifer elongatus]MCQ3829900.1 hypothetical protein [Microbulbifer elongatus]
MKSHLIIPLVLTLGFSGAALGDGADQQDLHRQKAAGSAYAAETMEHIETNTYQVPEVARQEGSTANSYLVEEQNREQYRQEMLKQKNRRALLSNVRSAQMQQVKAFLEEAQQSEQVAQESVPEAPAEATAQPMEQIAPALLEEEADRGAPAADVKLQTEDENPAETAQEPS